MSTVDTADRPGSGIVGARPRRAHRSERCRRPRTRTQRPHSPPGGRARAERDRCVPRNPRPAPRPAQPVLRRVHGSAGCRRGLPALSGNVGRHQRPGHRGGGTVHRDRAQPDHRVPRVQGDPPWGGRRHRDIRVLARRRLLHHRGRSAGRPRVQCADHQLPALQGEPHRRPGLGRAMDPQAPSHRLSGREDQAQGPRGGRHPRCRPDTALRGRGHRQCRVPHPLLPDCPAQRQAAVVVADRAQPTRTGGSAHRRGVLPGGRVHARQPLDVPDLGRRHLHLARHLRSSLRAPVGPRGRGLRSHPDGRFHDCRHHRLPGRPLQGSSHRDRHRLLLRHLPVPRGLPAQSAGHEAHREGDSRVDDHRHVDRRLAPGHHRCADRRSHCSNDPATPPRGRVPPPEPEGNRSPVSIAEQAIRRGIRLPAPAAAYRAKRHPRGARTGGRS